MDQVGVETELWDFDLRHPRVIPSSNESFHK